LQSFFVFISCLGVSNGEAKARPDHAEAHLTRSIPLALLPGLLLDAGLWRAQLEALSDIAGRIKQAIAEKKPS